jgi:hypothetical protein
MKTWLVLAFLGGCSLTGSDVTVSGRIGAMTASRSLAAAPAPTITHVMAVEPESASPQRTLAEIAGDGSFELHVDAGKPYVFVFVDSHAVGAAMAVAMFRANTLDTLSPQLAAHVDLGDVAIDPDMQTATPGVAYDDLLAQLGLSAAAAEYLGSVDDLSLRYANPDIDGDGQIDIEQHHDFALDFHVRSNMRTPAGTNYTIADITDQFLPDTATPVFNLTSAYVMYQTTFDTTDYVAMNMPSPTLQHGAAYVAMLPGNHEAQKPTSFSALHFSETTGWGADYDLEHDAALELPGSGGEPATLAYTLGATGITLTFTNIVTRPKASLTADGALAIFTRLATSDGTITAIDYKWMKRSAGAWVLASADEIALTIGSDGGYVSFHMLPSWSNEQGVQIPADPTGSVTPPGAIRPGDICGMAVSYDDKLGLRHFIGGADPNPGVTCTP